MEEVSVHGGGRGENVHMSQCLVYLYQLVLRRVALQGRNT